MNTNDLAAHVLNPARLAALRAVALLDTPTEESFDRLTGLAARFVGAPIALVSLIDADRQYFKSCRGLPEPWLSRRETPLSHSFCQYNRIARQPLLIEDARTHPVFKDNLAVHDLKVIAYLGIPLVTEDGYILGSFCVIDSRPRHWDDEDINVVENLAAAVMTEIHLRTEISNRTAVEKKLQMQNEELRKAYQDLEYETAERVRVLEELRQKDQLLIRQSRLAAMGEMISNIAHQWRQPLNVLGLQSQSLLLNFDKGKFDRESLQKSTDEAMKVINYMSKTIDDFRNFFKPTKDKTTFKLGEAIDLTVSLVKDGFKNSEVVIDVAISDDIEVTGYFNEFCQALLNILQNAKDAIVERNTVNRSIVIASVPGDDTAVITIKDYAGGIPPELLDTIFEPYFSTKGLQGTGIGLYMAKNIVENQMGGRLSVRNINEGAMFSIELPKTFCCQR